MRGINRDARHRRAILLTLVCWGTLSAAASSPLPPGTALLDVTFGQGTFVAVGINGAIFSSVAGGEWTQRTSGTTNELRAVGYGGGVFVAAGNNGTLLSSPDGVSWTIRSINASLSLPDIAYGNGRFVVGGKGPTGTWTMLVSSNGADWAGVSVEASASMLLPDGFPFGGVTFGAGKFLAVGGVYQGNLFLTSTDGVAWKEQGTVSLSGAAKGPITFGNGQFALISEYYDDDDDDGGPRQQLSVSEDSVNWRVIGFADWVTWSIAAADCTFVTASVFGGFQGSARATRGNSDSVFIPTSSTLHGLAYGNGSFVGVGTEIVTLSIPPELGPPFAITPATNVVAPQSYLALQVGPSCLDPPVRLQWRHNGTNLVGETNYYFSPAPLTTNHSGSYTVVASNAAGLSVTSQVATVFVDPGQAPPPQPPGFYFPTVTVTNFLSAGHNNSLNVSVSGWPPPVLQWSFNGTTVANATNRYLSIYNANEGAVGDYFVVASNALGSATSAVIRIELTNHPPAFNWFSTQLVAPEGARVVFPFLSYFDLGSPPARFTILKNETEPLLLPVPPFWPAPIFWRAAFSDAGEYALVARHNGLSYNVASFYLDVVPAGRFDRWTQRSPLPQNDALLDVTHGNGRFVAVGERGAIITSADGTNWSAHRLRTEANLAGVVHAGSLFVGAAGPNIVVSSNGIDWEARLMGSIEDFRAAAYGNGRFVAVGASSMMTSTDGNNWSDVELPATPFRQFRDVALSNVRFVAVGMGLVWISPDGLTWAPLLSGPSAEFESVTYANGLFVAVANEGRIFTSPDGLNWTERNSTVSNRLLGVAFGNGRWVVVGTRGRMLSSANAITWTRENSGTPDRLESVTFANGVFVAVGENGTTLSSVNGATWFKRNIGPTRDLDGMTLSPGGIVVVGKGGTVLTSTDGANFVERGSGVTNDLHGVGSGNGLVVAVGEVGAVVTSVDGIQWTPRVTASASSLKNAAWGNGQWIAVGTQGEMLGSPDGVTWSARPSPTANDLNGIAYGNGRFVAVGDNLPPNGTVLTSTDGQAWTRRNQYIGKNLRSVTFVNGTFLATANDGLLISSTDGLSWTRHSTWTNGPGRIENLRAAAWSDGVWVVVGNEGFIATSADLAQWKQHSIQTLENLHGIVPLGGRFVTIGNRGTILQSEGAAQPAILSGGPTPSGFSLVLSGEVGARYRIERSDRLGAVPWQTVAGVTLHQGATNIVDTSATNSAQRFYRAVSP